MIECLREIADEMTDSKRSLIGRERATLKSRTNVYSGDRARRVTTNSRRLMGDTRDNKFRARDSPADDEKHEKYGAI